MTPAVGDDGCLYVAGWAAGGDEGGDPLVILPFDEVIGSSDKNQNSGFEESELESGAIKQRFSQVDRNKDGTISREEYEHFRDLARSGRNLVLSIRPGPEGEATETHVRWRQSKLVPFCASPLYVDGMVFTVKDGGIVSCLDAATGKPMKQGRVEANGDYYASPVSADGKVYLIDEQGRLTVLSAKDKWETLHTANFEEDAYATPAVVDGRVYIRTAKALYAIGSR
jgi:outer membrane protein assembly factor BamB